MIDRQQPRRVYWGAALARYPPEPAETILTTTSRFRLPLAAALAFFLASGCAGGSRNPDGPTAPGTGGPGSGASATHPAGVIAATLSLPGRPHGVAIASSGRFCVSQIDAGSITCGMLSASGITLETSVAVGQTPAHVALSADGTRAYTANQYASTASVVDVSTSALSLLATVPLISEGFNVLADPGGSRVYVTTSSGALQVMDAGTRTIVAQVATGPNSNGVALDRAAGILYVSSIAAGTVAAVSTATNTVTKVYAVSPAPQRIALSADGKTLFVANESSGLDIVDVATGARSPVAGVAAGAVGLALAPDGKVVYVTNPPAGQVQIVDVATRQVTTLAGFERPRNVAFGLSGAAALVTDEGNQLYVIR
jgi:YVTN family beta-propeller protein